MDKDIEMIVKGYFEGKDLKGLLKKLNVKEEF